VARLNFAAALAGNRLKGTTVKFEPLLAGVDEHNRAAVGARLIALTLSGDISERTRAALTKTLEPAPAVASNSGPPNIPVAFEGKATPAPPPTYIAELTTLLIGSPEFQRR